MKQQKYTKQEAIRIIVSTAKQYHKLLENRSYLFIYRNRKNNQIEYFETIFLDRNFQHLTGIEFVDANQKKRNEPSLFYQACLDSRLKESDIKFKDDGTTPLKLYALPKIIEFLKSSKMTTMYNGVRPKLKLDRIAGTVNYCLGFSRAGDHYAPSSCLLEDIRNLGDDISQILAIMEKEVTKQPSTYSNIKYIAKGVSLNKIKLPDELADMISL